MNKKSNKLIKVSLMIIVFIITLVSLINIVDAKAYSSLKSLMSGPNIGNSITIGFQRNGKAQLTNNKNLYCIDKGAHISSVANKYTVKKYAKIVGKTVKFNNGNTSTSDKNAIMAYILGGGSWSKGYGTKGNYTSRQIALYNYWNTWAPSSWPNPSGNSKVSTTKTSRAIINSAKEYAKSNFVQANIKSNVGNTITSSNTNVGPFNVTYTGSITSIVVKDSNGNNVTSKLTFEQGGKIVSANKIQSGKDFYVKNSTGKTLKEIKIKVEAKETITAEIWLLQSGSKQRLIAAKTSKSPSSDDVTISIKQLGSITINKKDSKNADKKLIAGFKIQTAEGYLSGNVGGPYKYNNKDSKNATTYYTNANGNLTLTNLEYGTYKPWEVKAPEGYNLSDQKGYTTKKESNGIGAITGVPIGKSTGTKISASNSNVTFDIVNEEIEYINISGYVWLDVPNSKENDSNKIWDAGENKISGVKVNLKNKHNNKSVVAEVTTDSEGKYTFTKINKSQLSNLYIEFNYSRTEYKSAIPVAFDNTSENGSRALYNKVAKKDSELTGIVSTYTKTEKEYEYGLSGKIFANFYNKNNATLENINLGLKQLPETSYTLQQDIVNAEINLGGVKYTYTYGQRGNKDYEGVPTVNWQDKNDIRAYTADIYPSDIANIVENSEKNKDIYNKIDVKVKYKIDITNTTTYNIEELYVEKLLKVDEVKNLFDNTRYELADNNWENPTIKDGKTTVTMKDSYKNEVYGDGIASTKTKTAEITFKVKPEAIIEILKNPSGIIEEHPTKAGALAHHEYERKDYSWSNDISKAQTYQTNTTVEEDTAPYLVFKLGNQRAISGVVFEDRNKATNGEILGNGKLDDGENKLAGIKVELIDENGKVVNLYNTLAATNGEYTDYTTSGKAETTTDSNGVYTFVGILPDKYYIRFTYGNGEQSIADYKSTIVTSEAAKNALGYANNEYGHEWYRHIEANNYSVVVDNLELREKYNQNNAEVTEMKASTPCIEMKAICSETTKNKTKVKLNDSTEIDVDCYVYDVFNFGIIEQPEQKLDIAKNIINIKITNTQGNIVIEGNPAKDVMSGVTALNLEGDAIGYVRIELPEDEIYGSKLTITYAITVTNNSDLNYYEDKSNEHYGWYYMFGYKDSSTKEVTVKANEVIDYLDPSLTYVPSNQKEQVKEISYNAESALWISEDGTTINGAELTKLQELIASQEQYMIDQHAREDKYASVLSITGWEELYSTKTSKETVKTQDVVEIVAEKTLTTEDEDMEFISVVEILNAEPTASSLVAKTVDIPGNLESTISIMPPTGADMQTIIIYVATILSSIAILAVGIVIIKKKIL